MVSVSLESQPYTYNIEIAGGGLDQLGKLLRGLQEPKLGDKVLVVSQQEIFNHYGRQAIAALSAAKFAVAPEVILSTGEEYKTLNSVQKIYDAALANHLERNSTLVALGGGVIGDMTGFAAATWLRGINFVQVPTTLLAMVDAAIGGKTGVNHPEGKNLIGAFYQPRLVLIDPEVLNTLPDRELRAGMAEVIKYGVICDAELFTKMEQCERLDQMRYLNPNLLTTIVERSAQAKAKIVSEDEKEAGRRAILNYGHTIGHAIESVTGYKVVNHGEAVGIGMVAAGLLAVALDFWKLQDHERQVALIQKAGLPTQLPSGVKINEIIDTLQTDKKVKDGRVRFVLPTQLGAATLAHTVTPDLIRQVLQQIQA